MADIACPYELVTPAGTIDFNDGSIDQFYIQNITGLDGAPISAPIDEAGFTDGSIAFNWWERGRLITFEGVFLVLSVQNCGPAKVAIWNQMAEDLRVALRSTIPDETTFGTLTWTPTGLTQNVLDVRNQIPLDCPPDQGFQVRNFMFGLFAENPDWSGSS